MILSMVHTNLNNKNKNLECSYDIDNKTSFKVTYLK